MSPCLHASSSSCQCPCCNMSMLLQVDPNMQQSSLEALAAPHVDLANLPSAAMWDSLCQGLTACLTSSNKQILHLASSLLTTLSVDFSKLGDHAGTAQLFCCIADAAAAQAASVQASEAIWQACLPVVKRLAVQLPQTCAYHSDAVLSNIVQAVCKLLRLMMEQPHSPLQHSIVVSLGSHVSMAWWHSWLARSKIAKVKAICTLSVQMRPLWMMKVHVLFWISQGAMCTRSCESILNLDLSYRAGRCPSTLPAVDRI